MTLFKRPIHLKSLLSLVIIFVLGSALLSLVYYGFSYTTLKEIKALKIEIEQLDHDIESMATQQVRLSKAPIPNKEELLRYAGMIPKDREILRFLRALDGIVKGTGLQLVSLQINENQPISSDLLDKLLVFLDERTESLPELSTKTQREDFIGNLLAQMDDQYKTPTANGDTGTAVAPQDDGPLKQVILHIEYGGNYAQLNQFLKLVRDLDRVTYVDNINHTATAGGLDLTIFYYEGDFPFIPALP